MDTEHVHWPSIDQFHNNRKYFKDRDGLRMGLVTYRAKVKLHGTCAGIQRSKDGLKAFSRECVLTREKDNAGFAKWSLDQNWQIIDGITLFGEWCGPGIVNGATAISAMKEKVFVVFAAITSDGKRIQEPFELAPMIAGVERAYVLPWYGEAVVFDWHDTDEALQPMLDDVNARVEAVETCDPYVKSVFGIDGVGEGLVFYPVSPSDVINTAPLFKAKGGAHRVQKAKTAVQLDATIVASIEEFVELALPEPRLKQGLDVVGGADKKNMGAFMTWINKDVEKETKTELEAAGLTIKQVNKPISDKARAWFMAQLAK